MNSIESGRKALPANADLAPVSGPGPLARRVADQSEATLATYLSILRRRRFIVIGIFAATVLVGLILTLLMTPKYEASATIEIQRQSENFTRVEGAESTRASSVDQEFYQTQYGLLGSRSLAERVASDLKLADDPKFFARFKHSKTEQWFENGRVKLNASSRAERLTAAGKILLDNVEIAPQRQSRLVDINFRSPDAKFSQLIANTWATRFIKVTLERRFDATVYARQFLENRLEQLKGRIDQSERALVGYASREGIVNLPATTPQSGEGGITGERSLVADNLASLNRELSRATADRVAAEARLGLSSDASTEALQNDALTALRRDRSQIGAEYAKLMSQFQPDYPPARALASQMANLDRSISREEARIKNSLRETYRASLARQTDLQKRVVELTGGLLDLRRRSIQYNIYQRETDTNRELYTALLQRYKEIGIAGGVGVNNISVVDSAEEPRLPSSPRIFLNMFVAMLVGLAAGVGAAILRDQIDDGVSDPAEVEEALHLSLLGTTPKASGSLLEALEDRKSPLSEAYLSLQTNLQFSTDHGVPKSFAVTSSRPAEGKSTTSFALAVSLARSDRRVLLIDGDMRSPSVHGLVGVDNKAGLSNFLSGDDDHRRLVQATDRPNLFVVTAGPPPPSAAELLSSDRMRLIVEAYTAEFDHVVIDAPPVMGLADAPLICSRVDGTIFVIESHNTKKSVARTAAARLASVNLRLLGVVLTKFDAKKAEYGYGYDYGYGYGYGSDAKGKAA